MLSLKHGNQKEYSELVSQAMMATDNILNLKYSRNTGNNSDSNSSTLNLNTGKCPHNRQKKVRDDKAGANAEAIVKLLDQMSIKGDNHDNQKAKTKDSNKVLRMQEQLLHELRKQNNSTCQKVINMVNTDTSDTEAEIGTTNKQNKTSEEKKKITSGKCAKPYDTDIVLGVKFPHKRLDPRHTQGIKYL